MSRNGCKLLMNCSCYIDYRVSDCEAINEECLRFLSLF